jgi:hypothetical protein
VPTRSKLKPFIFTISGSFQDRRPGADLLIVAGGVLAGTMSLFHASASKPVGLGDRRQLGQQRERFGVVTAIARSLPAPDLRLRGCMTAKIICVSPCTVDSTAGAAVERHVHRVDAGHRLQHRR